MSSDPDLTLVLLYSRYRDECFADIAALAIVAWDWCMTLGDEIEYFWLFRTRTRYISIPSLLFFATRYYSICIVILNSIMYLGGYIVHKSICGPFFQYMYYNTALVNILLVQLIMATRLTGMFTEKLPIAITLVTLAVANLLGTGLLVNTGVYKILSGDSPLTVCLSIIGGTDEVSNWTIWMPIIIFDYAIFLFAVKKSSSFLRQTTLSKSLGARLLRVLRRDSITFFAAILVLYSANAWTWGHHRAGLYQSLTVAVNSTLSARTLINLRKEASKSNCPTSIGPLIQDSGFVNEDTEMHPIRFGHPNQEETYSERDDDPTDNEEIGWAI